jgi:outer membrane protein assembly factor BamD (BamD/ComL family)
MSIARYQMSAKNYVGAIKNLNEVVNRHHSTNQVFEAYYRLAEIYFRIGVKDEALELINILKESDPTNYWTIESLKFSPKPKNSSKLRIFSKDE